ncbi:hypothetical protein [Methanoplanus limicola]|uniref:Uncharacterized protein n=1 Tax=Methanoplanus limicola DSM 2279 TaxID=937775 RepID=H1Z2Q3_9EURY|nr:hypothetical protein [Methanoplanus limicola]EHQ36456.1 hypothetical protein Metlim_2406 [Methanoplanus limicola DSM 2279]
MKSTTALSRILGLEPKQRITSTIRIEKELLDVISNHKLEKSDTLNISIQRFMNIHGIPVLLMAMEPDGVRVRPLDMSDVANLALLDMLQNKGYVRS